MRLELEKSENENARNYMKNYEASLDSAKKKRTDEPKLKADRHCQVYFLSNEIDSVEKLTKKKFILEQLKQEKGKFDYAQSTTIRLLNP